MGRDQQWVKLSRDAMHILTGAKIKQDREGYVNALICNTVPQLNDLRDLRYAAEALQSFLTRSGMTVQQRTEDGQWEWVQKLTERARNGETRIERQGGGFPSKWLAQANALRRLDEDYSAWRASQDIE